MYRQFVALSGLAMAFILMDHSANFVMTIPQMLGNTAVGGWQQSILNMFEVLGIIAVPIYFVVSGSFLAYALQSISRGRRPRDFMKLIWSSLQRILWPYVIWSTVFYVVVYFFYNIRFEPLQYLKNLLVGYPYHFVPLLVFFYLLSPIVFWFGKRYPILMLSIILLYQMFLANIVTPGFLGFVFPEWVNRFRLPVLAQTMSEWAIFFPLGIVYSLHKSRTNPWLLKYRPVFIVVFLLSCILAILNRISLVGTPQADIICQLAFVCLVPTVDRNSIPMVGALEQIGKRSYGFYLTQYIVFDLILYLIHVFAPVMFSYPIILALACFISALVIPFAIMVRMTKPPTNSIYVYFFG